MSNRTKGYKAFNPNWTCQNFKFEVGKTYTHDGPVELCQSGFHFCEYPLDILNYYPPTSKFARVEGEGVQKAYDGTKVVCQKLNVETEISLKVLIDESVKYILDRVEKKKETNTGDWSAATNTGNESAAIVEGKESIAIVTGYESKAKGALGCWLVLIERDDKLAIIGGQIKKVDGVTIKADTFYWLKNGVLVES